MPKIPAWKVRSRKKAAAGEKLAFRATAATGAPRGGKAPNTSTAKKGRGKNAEYVHDENFILNFPDEAEILVAIADCYLPWLKHQGHLSGKVPEEIAGQMRDSEWKQTSAQNASLWSAALKKVETEMDTEGVVLSPLISHMLEEIAFTQDTWAQDTWAEESEPGAAVTELKIPRELARTQEALKEWISQGASYEEIRLNDHESGAPIGGQDDLRRKLTQLYLRHTPRAQSVEGIEDMNWLIRKAGAQALAENARLTQKSGKALLAWLAGNITDDDLHETDGEAFVTLRKRGIEPSADLTQVLRMIALPSYSRNILAYVHTLTADRALRAKLAEDSGALPGLILSTQGQAWVETITNAANRAQTNDSWEDWPFDEIGRADDWNLEGVTRADLVPLATVSNKGARNQVLGLMARIRDIEKRQALKVPPTTTRGGRAVGR